MAAAICHTHKDARAERHSIIISSPSNYGGLLGFTRSRIARTIVIIPLSFVDSDFPVYSFKRFWTNLTKGYFKPISLHAFSRTQAERKRTFITKVLDPTWLTPHR
jgi:hypothetical protein